ncbi:MAG: cysteine--tRNA ligase [Erysipelothrix sp.]|nr:cysteine--tRNA ligase [Erysipelothrix sp.]
MKLYNSYTQTLETFTPIKANEVSMYVCGPTVYNHAHIGNARPLVVFDTLRRVFEALDYKVKYVSNYTDVDDRIIQQALEQNVSELDVASYYIKEYEKVIADLNCELPTEIVKVTETMDEIIDFIQQLLAADKAYQTDKDVYFKIDEIENYGALSKQNLEDLVVGARVEANLEKINPLDFTLWKQTDQGIAWDSPFGRGRPGWHTECVVMIQEKFNHQRIDIHGGGMDLKFPHHENEIAQCEALHDHNIANYWVHNGMLNIDGEKMSKSLGNVVWAKDFIEELGGDVVRWLLLSTHYRAPLNISQETITQAQSEIHRIKTALKAAQLHLQLGQIEASETIDQVMLDAFLKAMSDDLNTQNGFKVLFVTVKALNQSLRHQKDDYELIQKQTNALTKMLNVLGIKYDILTLSDADRALFDAWQTAKAEKQFDRADQYRQQLIDKGFF